MMNEKNEDQSISSSRASNTQNNEILDDNKSDDFEDVYMSESNHGKNSQGSNNILGIFFSHFFLLIVLIIVAIIVAFTAFRQTSGPFHSYIPLPASSYTESSQDNESTINVNTQKTSSSPKESEFLKLSDLPFYFVQISDLHFTGFVENRKQKVTNILSYISHNIQPPLIIVTGDIVDATASNSDSFQKRKQIEENWIDYFEALKDSEIISTDTSMPKLKANLDNKEVFEPLLNAIHSKTRFHFTIINENLQVFKVEHNGKYPTILEMMGNHDMFNIRNENSESNLFKKYANHQVRSSRIESFIIPWTDKKSIKIVTFNPGSFPFPSAPLGNIIYVDDDTLDLVDKHLAYDGESMNYSEDITNDHVNIVVSHFPFTALYTDSPKKQNKVFSKTDLILTGHTHPSSRKIYHYNKLIPHVITPTQSRYYNFGLVTVDLNGHSLVYHQVDYDENNSDNPVACVTFPIPYEQLSNNQIFDFENRSMIPVRLILMNPSAIENNPIHVFIDSKSYGKMEFKEHINENADFYETVVISNNEFSGKHTLEIRCKDKVLQSFDFYVGQESPKMKESLVSIFSADLFFTLLGVCGFCVLIRLIPFWFIFKDAYKILDKYERYIYYIEDKEYFPVYKQVYLGPWYIISRLRKVPTSVYFIFVFLFLWYLPLFLFVATIEDGKYPMFVWGFLSDHKLKRINETVWFVAFYYLIYMLPLIDIAGLSFELEVNDEDGKHYKRFDALHIFEFAFFSFFWIFILIVWLILMCLEGGAFAVFASPMTYITIGSGIAINCLIFIPRKFNRSIQVEVK